MLGARAYRYDGAWTGDRPWLFKPEAVERVCDILTTRWDRKNWMIGEANEDMTRWFFESEEGQEARRWLSRLGKEHWRNGTGFAPGGVKQLAGHHRRPHYGRWTGAAGGRKGLGKKKNVSHRFRLPDGFTVESYLMARVKADPLLLEREAQLFAGVTKPRRISLPWWSA